MTELTDNGKPYSVSAMVSSRKPKSRRRPPLAPIAAPPNENSRSGWEIAYEAFRQHAERQMGPEAVRRIFAAVEAEAARDLAAPAAREPEKRNL